MRQLGLAGHSVIARALMAIGSVAVTGSAAFAHHPTGGQTPATLWHGFLSGIGHPLIGLDHFIFVAAVAVALAASRNAVLASGTLVVSGLAGTTAHAVGADVPMAEMLIAVSLVAVGVGLLATSLGHRLPELRVVLVFLATAGFVHGYAWGESIVGADMPVLGSYLAGLALVQFSVLATVISGIRRLIEWQPNLSMSGQMAAGAVALAAGAGLLVFG